jgi:hypothetical protein
VPAAGQQWTSLLELENTRANKVVPDEEDGRISLIHTEPGFGINQTRQSDPAQVHSHTETDFQLSSLRLPMGHTYGTVRPSFRLT